MPGTQRFIDGASVFNGEVGYAAVGVHLVGSVERVSGAGLDAAGTCAAAIGLGQRGNAFRGLKAPAPSPTRKASRRCFSSPPLLSFIDSLTC